jgi:hypothetical protein
VFEGVSHECAGVVCWELEGLNYGQNGIVH